MNNKITSVFTEKKKKKEEKKMCQLIIIVNFTRLFLEKVENLTVTISFGK